ncbi:uncharacterized protein LOC123688683 isoform X2 [Harmonia axyridis]|uniref:uncharacterized protein LOC123688683 isoform X2 n=1 Tax=Harmonia axyridis TaxID=115357 RepID=UPI001E27715C|nr:uncharacterized protein LOC123688683 isoform X2 [Harmonia axyridis]
MAYAVVHFIEDDVFSEVPVSWLNFDNTECVWPPNNPKNVRNLIKMRAAPKSDWPSHKVNLEGIYEKYEKAIKKAGNNDYTSSADEVRGRGMRKKIPQYSSSESDSMTPPPFINLQGTEVIWEQSDNAFSMTDMISVEQNIDVNSLEDITPFHDEAINKASSSTHHITCASTQAEFVPYENKLEKKIDVLLALVNSMSIKMEEMNERLKHIEVTQQPNTANLKFFLENLPCDSMEDMKRLNDLLEKEEEKNNFINYLQTIGGAHPKDRVKRMMKTIMTNKLALSCSWLGLRNNIRASDFLCIKIAQSFASQSFIQNAEFEKIAAEWIRLASLRFKREK